MAKLHPCACGCNELTYGTFKRDHPIDPIKADHKPPPDWPLPDPEPEDPDTPRNVSRETKNLVTAEASGTMPPNSGTIDRRRWRLAEDRPNTAKTNPWLVTKCTNCLGIMYARDPQAVWEKGGVCEECGYILRTELVDHGQRQGRVQTRTLVNPFRSRA